MVRSEFPQARRIAVLCGRGNNGGDGMAAARLLHQAGLEVAVILLGSSDGLKGDAAEAWRELAAVPGVSIHVVETASDLAGLDPARDADLMIDAVLGTGFKPPIKGLALDALRVDQGTGAVRFSRSICRRAGRPIATSATVDTPVFPADAVITFTAPKPAHVFGAIDARAGTSRLSLRRSARPMSCLFPNAVFDWAGSSLELVQAPRAASANKGNFGHVLVVGGTFGSAGGKAGAPAMTSLAALRVGAGLVTAAVPAPAMPVVSAIAPELMTWPLDANAAGQVSAKRISSPNDWLRSSAAKLCSLSGRASAKAPRLPNSLPVCFHPQNCPPCLTPMRSIFWRQSRCCWPSWRAKAKRTLVLTPHPGEMARLAGTTIAEVQANRLETARSFATKSWRNSCA